MVLSTKVQQPLLLAVRAGVCGGACPGDTIEERVALLLPPLFPLCSRLLHHSTRILKAAKTERDKQAAGGLQMYYILRSAPP